mgnify:FL=1|tara:strand:- start:131 stop:505 length:375 start_codon:yes stop_codon:yes gene_type:complete
MSKRKSFNVPRSEELDDYYKKAKKRSIKIAKKKSSIKKTYQDYCQTLISEIILDEDIKHDYIFLKTLTLGCIKEMIKEHNDASKINKEDSEAYIIDKLKLEITYDIIREVIWGDKDWYHSNNGY